MKRGCRYDRFQHRQQPLPPSYYYIIEQIYQLIYQKKILSCSLQTLNTNNLSIFLRPDSPILQFTFNSRRQESKYYELLRPA